MSLNSSKTPFAVRARLAPGALFLAASLAMAAPAGVSSTRDPQWDALADAHRFVELEQSAAARLATQPEDSEAWQAYVDGVLGQPGAQGSAHRDAALAKLRACVKATPQLAACHYGVGAVTGVQVMSQGLMKAAFGIGEVRDEFVAALDIDPTFYPARAGLVQFYLLVPGLAGGSVSSAREVAQQARLRQPEYAKLLDSMILLYDDKPADAEKLLATVPQGSDAMLADESRGQWISLGFAWLKTKQPARARAAFERVLKDKPEEAVAHYGLACSWSDEKQWDGALGELRLAATLPGHDDLPIDYRLGIVFQGKGDVSQARAAFTRYLASANINSHNADDAKKRLADLG